MRVCQFFPLMFKYAHFESLLADRNDAISSYQCAFALTVVTLTYTAISPLYTRNVDRDERDRRLVNAIGQCSSRYANTVPNPSVRFAHCMTSPRRANSGRDSPTAEMKGVTATILAKGGLTKSNDGQDP